MSELSPEGRKREAERVSRWHQTYNAAVAGILAWDARQRPDEVDTRARAVADKAHGPL